VADGGARPAPNSCPVCGGDGMPFVAHNGFELFSCAACGTVYIHPRPTEAFLRDFYQGQNRYYFDKVAKKLRRARNRLRWLRWFVRGGRFLDIGCHGGFAVEAAREAGFAACGLDLDADAIDYARRQYPRNTYYNASIGDVARDHAGEFSLIHCAEVIEHVPDGRGFAAAAFTLLRPGGYFYLTTPDISHWRRPKDVLAWNRFVPPEHLTYYNPDSLKLLLRQAGFAIVARKLSLKPQLNLLARKPVTAGRPSGRFD
jgi:SAM-dependent methyltransferase